MKVNKHYTTKKAYAELTIHSLKLGISTDALVNHLLQEITGTTTDRNRPKYIGKDGKLDKELKL